MLLHDENDADQVGQAATAPTCRRSRAGFRTPSSGDDGHGHEFLLILDGIVMLIVAVIIANTLLMAVFGRIREMGILSALGMKRRQVMQMMMIFEANASSRWPASSWAWRLAGLRRPAHTERLRHGRNGRLDAHHPRSVLSSYAKFAPETFAWLAVWTFIIALLASLYPAGSLPPGAGQGAATLRRRRRRFPTFRRAGAASSAGN